MKKFSLVIFLILMIVFLNSCNLEPNKHRVIYDEIIEELKINPDNVTSDFNLLEQSKNYPEAIINYNTNKPSNLQIESYNAKIIQTKEDVHVKLIINITLDEERKTFELDLIILKDPLYKETYSLSFYVENNLYDKIYITENNLVEFPIPPIKEGYIFIGWSYENKIIEDTFIINKSIKLNAIFNDLSNHNIINTSDLYNYGVHGISYIEISYKNNTLENKNIEVVINEEASKIYETITNEGKIVLSNVNIYGEYILEVILDEGIKIDNIMIVDNTYETLLKEDFKLIDIKKEYYKDSQINLINIGLRGSNISWELKDSNNSKYINLTNGKIIAPLDELIYVSLVVTLTMQEHAYEEEIILKIGLPNKINLINVKELKNGEAARIEGTIIGSFYKDGYQNYFIKDNDTQTLIQTDLKEILANGNKFIITGIMKEEGFYFDKIEKIGYEEVLPDLLINYESLKSNLYNKVYVEGISTSNLENGKFSIFLDKKIDVYNISEEFVDIVSGMYIELIGYVVLVNDQYSIYIDNIDYVNILSITNNQIINIIMSSINFNELLTYPINKDIKLPLKDPIFNSELIWESEHQQYVSNEGIYNKPDKMIDSTLKLSIVLDGKLLGVRIIKIKILP